MTISPGHHDFHRLLGPRLIVLRRNRFAEEALKVKAQPYIPKS